MWEAILKNRGAFVVVGGGETIASLDLLGVKPLKLMATRKNIFLSTGGGAMLEFLSGKKLPGVEVLK
jgi:phosphoglycerate kinase